VSDVCGYDDAHDCVRLKTGFAAVIHIPGIDIINYKPNDKEYSFYTFGQATQVCPVPFKVVFLSDHADYAEQLGNLRARLEKTEHPYRRYLLQRQAEWLEYYQTAQTDRFAYLFFLGATAPEASDAAELYIRVFRAGRNYAARCGRGQCERIFQVLLQGSDAT
jgi:hypothetical protein